MGYDRRMKPALPLLALTVAVALASCGGTEPPTDGGTTACTQAVLPASVRAASVLQTSVSAPDWTVPHVPGRVLVVGSGGTSTLR